MCHAKLGRIKCKSIIKCSLFAFEVVCSSLCVKKLLWNLIKILFNGIFY